MQGRVVVHERGGLRFHSYIAPEASFFVNAHAIELPTCLVVVDTQFLAPFAAEARATFDALGKPVERVIITHGHPDHWFGLSRWGDRPTYALPGVTDFIAGTGAALRAQYRGNMGEMVDEAHVVPAHAIAPGTATIDGVDFLFESVSGAEAGLQLLIKLPSARTVVAQDFLYNGVHSYLEDLDPDTWIAKLEELDGDPGYDFGLPGHGEARALGEAVGQNLTYLRFAKELIDAKTPPDEMRETLLRQFPEHAGENIVDLWIRLAFPEG